MPVNSFDNYPMTWKPDLSNIKGPLYKALASLLEEDIKNGVLNPGDKLPPQRELADFLDANVSLLQGLKMPYAQFYPLFFNLGIALVLIH